MKIELWGDYVCPFCYMGKRHLDIALRELHLTEDVDIKFRSFQLNPEMTGYSGEGMQELLSRKYNISLGEAGKNLREVGERAERVDLNYNFEIMKPTNTLDAHRLTKYAETLGKDFALAENILKGYFEKGALISDHDQLLDLAENADLAKPKVYEVLSNPKAYKDEVMEDIAMAEKLEINSVPYFLINKEHVIPGSESVETFVITLQKILDMSSDSSVK